MSQVEEDIIERILQIVAEKGGRRAQWYVGVAKDPKKALFKEHHVPKSGNPWFFKHAMDHTEALRIQDRLLREGLDGAAFNKDVKATGIYLYRKSGHTKE